MQCHRRLLLCHLLGLSVGPHAEYSRAGFLLAWCYKIYKQVPSITSSEECQRLRIFNVLLYCKTKFTICSETARNKLLNSDLCYMCLKWELLGYSLIVVEGMGVEESTRVRDHFTMMTVQSQILVYPVRPSKSSKGIDTHGPCAHAGITLSGTP